MKSKALVLGALPGPFVGPVVPLNDGREWVVEVPEGVIGTLFAVGDNSTPVQYPLEDGFVLVEVLTAKVEIEETNGVELVTVVARCLDA